MNSPPAINAPELPAEIKRSPSPFFIILMPMTIEDSVFVRTALTGASSFVIMSAAWRTVICPLSYLCFASSAFILFSSPTIMILCFISEAANVAPFTISKGRAEVIVCDGFVGNVILKLTEGLAWNIFKLLKSKFTDGAKAKIGALLLSDKLVEIKNEFDYSEYGGAPILGVKGAIVKMHGSSNAKSVKNTILKGIPYVENNVVQIIQNSVVEIEEILISE